MVINHNLNAMNAHRQMIGNTSTAGKAMEKLSSGLRINRAGDDAAGLAISEKMRGQIRGLDQASRNAQDGISMIQTAEGALNETHSILQRMRELAVQSANDTNANVDRGELQKEINQLTDEIDRIANNTEFNTKKLLNGSLGGIRNGSVTIAEGTVSFDASHSSATIANATGVVNITDQTVGKHELTLSAGVQSTLKSTLNGLKGNETLASLGVTSVAGLVTSSTTTGAAVAGNALTLSSTVNDFIATINGQNGLSAELNAQGEIEVYQTAAAANKLTLSSTAAAGTELTNVLFGATAAGANSTTGSVTATDFTVSDKFTDVSGNVTTTAYRGAAFNGAAAAVNAWHGASITIAGAAAAGDTITFSGLEAKDSQAARVTDGRASLQIGANENQSINVDIEDMSASALGVRVGGNAIQVTSSKLAARAMTKFNDAIEAVSAERAKLGAYQNRLEHTIANLGTSSENLQASESRIRDVDMAKEMMNYSKTNILTQAAQAMLAQANQAPQNVLQLLR